MKTIALHALVCCSLLMAHQPEERPVAIDKQEKSQRQATFLADTVLPVTHYAVGAVPQLVEFVLSRHASAPNTLRLVSAAAAVYTVFAATIDKRAREHIAESTNTLVTKPEYSPMLRCLQGWILSYAASVVYDSVMYR